MQDLEYSEPSTDTEVYIGIDVSKRELEIYFHPSGHTLTIDNNKAGFATLRPYLTLPAQAYHATFEATGRYHRAIHRYLYTLGIKTSLVSPYQSRHFCKAMMQFTKTDKVDAHMLAKMGAMLEIQQVDPPPKALETLREWVTQRHQLITAKTALICQIKETNIPAILAMMQTRLRCLIRQIERCKTMISKQIKAQPEMKARYDILMSIPGIGFVNAVTLITCMPELGHVDEKQAAALLGVAPYARDSGEFVGKRRIWGGRKNVRDSLYMAALSNTRTKTGFRPFLDKLMERGKPYKVAIVAVMRKLIILANALLRDNRKWQPIAP